MHATIAGWDGGDWQILNEQDGLLVYALAVYKHQLVRSVVDPDGFSR